MIAATNEALWLRPLMSSESQICQKLLSLLGLGVEAIWYAARLQGMSVLDGEIDNAGVHDKELHTGPQAPS